MTAIVFGCTPKLSNTSKTETSNPPEENIIGVAESNASELDQKIPFDSNVRTGTLSNGLKYFIKKNSKPENRAELRLALNAGSMQEDEDQQGLAHFVEHMCFNGTENFEKSELVDYLESIGTKFGPDLNAYTSFDETVYMLQSRTDDQEILDKGMLVLQDWASAVTFDHEEIDKERGVVQSEWRSRLGAGERMQAQTLPVVYQGSRYAERLPIGKREIIEGADYETVKRFYKDWYRPNLMAVIVVGDIDLDQMEADIKKRFSGLKNPENPRVKKDYDVPNHKETLVTIATDKEATSTNVQVMYKHPAKALKTKNDYRQSIVRNLYNRMLGSRLDELTQKADPPFTYAYSGYGGSYARTTDSYYSYAGVNENQALRGLEAVLLENERVLKYGFNASELEREKKDLFKYIEKQYKERDKTESGRLARGLVAHFLEDYPMPNAESIFEMYGKYLPTISVSEVNSLAKNWITLENRVVSVTGPEKEGVTMPTEAEIREVLEKVTKTAVSEYEDVVVDAPLLAKKLPATKIAKEEKIDKVDVTELILENGVRVLLKPTDFKNDEIMFTAYSPGGHSNVSDADFIAASQASSIVNQSGVGEFDAIALSKKLAGQNVSVRTSIYELSEGMSGSSSPDDAETMMKLIYLYFNNPRFDETALQAYILGQKSFLGNLSANPAFFFNEITYKEMNSNHPRKMFFPTIEQYESIKLEQVKKIYEDRFADASDFTFIFVGAFDLEKFKVLAQTYLGNLPVKEREDNWKDLKAKTPAAGTNKTFKKGQAPKSYVKVMYKNEFDWDDNEAKYNLSSTIKLLQIKLREALREDEGGVYGVGVSGYSSKIPYEESTASFSFNANPEDLDNLIAVAFKEIEKVKKDGVEEKDLIKIRETQIQERVKNLKTNRFWMYRIQSRSRYNLPYDGILLDEYKSAVEKLNADDIQKMTQFIFDDKYMHIFKMNPEG